MSCDQAKQIWGLALSQPHREVLRAYIDCMDEDGLSRPKVQDVAWMTDYHVRHVQRLTRELEAAGLLVAHPRKGKTTEYEIDLSKGVTKPPQMSVVLFVTPDIQIAPLTGGDISDGVTPDSTGDMQRGAAQIAPHEPAHAQQPDLESLNALTAKDQELKDKKAAAARAREDESSPEPPRIYAVYVENMRQQITPIVRDKLVDAVKEFGEQWVEDAIVEAVTHNAKTWAYVETILDSWGKKGRDTPRPSSVKGAGLKRAPSTPVEDTNDSPLIRKIHGIGERHADSSADSSARNQPRGKGLLGFDTPATTGEPTAAK